MLSIKHLAFSQRPSTNIFINPLFSLSSMTIPRYRSRTFRRVFVRTPGSDTVIQYRRRKNAKPQCATCGANLPGVARGTKNMVKALPRSARRPERPFGGKLCSACSRRAIIAKFRV